MIQPHSLFPHTLRCHISLPKPVRKPLQHRLRLLRRPRRQRLPSLLPLLNIPTHNTALLPPLRALCRRCSVLRHLHALVGIRLCRAGRRTVHGGRITVVYGWGLWPGSILALLVGLLRGVRVLGVVEGEVVLGDVCLAVAFALLPADEKLFPD